MEEAVKHILVPLDGSEAAEVTFNDAAVLARSLEADITLLEVVLPLGDVIKTDRWEVCVDGEWPGRVRRAVSYLLSVAERPVWKEISVRAVVEMGEITETITSFARSHSIDYIVWPPTPLGEAAARLALEPDSLPPPQTFSASTPSRPNWRVFKHGLIYNETGEPRILEDSKEKLQTQITGG